MTLHSSSLRTAFRIAVAAGTLVLPGATAVLAQTATPEPIYRWTTFAGRAITGYDDGPLAEARFNAPHGLAQDAMGNLYVADTLNHTIRKITPQGVVSTLAGSPGQSGSADGTGSAARFLLPKGVAVDTNGNVYVADSGNHTVRKITPAGVVTTLAGTAGSAGSTDGTGSAARFSSPTSIFADASGYVYVVQEGMRRIAPNGSVDTLNLRGTIAVPGGTQVTLTLAGSAAAVDSAGQIYFPARPLRPDGSLGETKRIVKRDLAGALTILASSDPADGKPFVSTNVSEVIMTTDSAGSVYFVTQLVSSIIEYGLGKITPAGTLSGLRWRGASRGGFGDAPKGLVATADGKIYHTAPNADDVIFLNQGDSTAIYAGTPWSNRGADGSGASARFSNISDLAFSPAGQLLVSDNYSYYFVDSYGGASLRVVSPAGETSTRYTGPARESPPETALDVAPLASGNTVLGIYFATTRLTQIAPDGSATPLPKGDFYEIRGIDSDSDGRLFVAGLRAVHRRALDGTWTILAGAPDQPSDIVDGTGGNARFSHLTCLDVGPDGDVYVLDHPASPARAAIRRIQPDGTTTTVQTNMINSDGSAPAKFTVDAKGDFITTYSDDTVRLRTASGAEFIIGGTPNRLGTRDGVGQSALFYQPGSIAADAHNNLIVADNAGVVLRKGEFFGYRALISSHPQSLTVAAGSSAQFSVAASGTPAPTYQWQFNGTAISGATGSTLTLSNVTSANAGDYTVVVSNDLGSITSNKATLTVTAAPPPPSSPPSGGGGGGGGAPSVWFIAALIICSIARHAVRR